MTTPRTLRATSPDDILALVPRMLGFHPEDSLCLVGLGDPGFHARVDLPASAREEEVVGAIAESLAEAADRQGLARAVLVAYSDDAGVAGVALAALYEELTDRAIDVPLVLRADGRRWFCVDPDNGECLDGCSAAGTPYDLTSHPFTVAGVVDGEVVYASRAALQATLSGADPVDREAVAAAAEREVARLRSRRRHPLGPPTPELFEALLREEEEWTRERVAVAVRDGTWLDAQDAGRLLGALTQATVHETAWCAMTRPQARRLVDLWRDLVRRAPDELAGPPAGLLAFAAWLAGDGALAWCAVDRCHQVQPTNAVAALVGAILAGAVPPSSWDAVAAG